MKLPARRKAPECKWCSNLVPADAWASARPAGFGSQPFPGHAGIEKKCNADYKYMAGP